MSVVRRLFIPALYLGYASPAISSSPDVKEIYICKDLESRSNFELEIPVKKGFTNLLRVNPETREPEAEVLYDWSSIGTTPHSEYKMREIYEIQESIEPEVPEGFPKKFALDYILADNQRIPLFVLLKIYTGGGNAIFKMKCKR